jgi:hypothetical protein
VSEEAVTSIRQAAAVCNVTPPVVRRWRSLGLIPGPPWTLKQLLKVRDATDPGGRRTGPQMAHGTMPRWNSGCSCDACRQANSDNVKARLRRKAQARFPTDKRQQLVDSIYAGKPFRETLREVELTSNQVFGLARVDEEWSTALETALTATRRYDLKPGTNAAYVAGCVCCDCREHQRVRMARNR